MQIAVFGLGYVGCVAAACLARDGHRVIGVDPNPVKTAAIAAGESPIVEPGLAPLIADARAAGRLEATADAAAALADAEISLICVGTPSLPGGAPDPAYVERVSREIAAALAARAAPAAGPRRHTVVLRSTVLPGTTEGLVRPILGAALGDAFGTAVGLAFHPEFLREGRALADYDEPPKTVIGAADAETHTAVRALYPKLRGPCIETDIESAEMVKYADNAWHALKVGFANEIGLLCKAQGLDGQAVMRIFCQDTKLNLSARYLRPGFAFGGSCLPKDLRALNHRARALDLELPILRAILPSNRQHIEQALALIETVAARAKARRIGILGFSFKAETDDLRESPMVDLIERLLGKGHDLRLYDPNVRLDRLTGANREFVLRRIPHLAGLMNDSLPPVLEHAEIVLIGHLWPGLEALSKGLRADQHVIDLAGWRGPVPRAEHYHGIAWA